MIPAKTSRNQHTPGWKAAQAAAVTNPAELLKILDLDDSLLPAAEAAARLFPLRVPRGFVARMEKGNPADPLLRQVLPLNVELDETPGYVTDPLQESAARRAPGLLQKYSGRALLTITGACGVHCRYCFRRHFPYAGENPRKDWPLVLDAIRADASLEEVILSGGDPLMLDTPRLRQILAELAEIPHIRRLRIHTRQPVVLPERVDAELLDCLKDTSLPLTMVLHVNHPNEIDAALRDALMQLRESGVMLLNQSVLLRGVNDDADTLAELSRKLFEAGVLPCYLHMLDPVAGAAHFDIPDEKARTLWRDLHARLSGYLVPRLVREIPGEPGKTLINL